MRYQQIRHLQWNDMNGVARARQVVDEIHLPQHMMQANDNGIGWDNGDDYYKKGPGMDDELDQTQYYDGRPWQATDPTGQRAVTQDEANELFRVHKQNHLRIGDGNRYSNVGYGADDETGYRRQYEENDDPRNGNSVANGYGTVNASSIRPQDSMPLDPYMNEVVQKQIKDTKRVDDLEDQVNKLTGALAATISPQTDNAAPVNEYSANQVVEREPVARVAEATVNLLNEPQISYVALEQIGPNQGVVDALSMFVTSPREKRGRSNSMVQESMAPEVSQGAKYQRLEGAEKGQLMITAP